MASALPTPSNPIKGQQQKEVKMNDDDRKKRIKELDDALNEAYSDLIEATQCDTANNDRIKKLETLIACGEMTLKAYKNENIPFYAESLESVVNALISYNELLSSKEIASPIKARQLRQMLKPRNKNEDTWILIPIKKGLYDAFIGHCSKNNDSVRFVIHKAIKKHMKSNA
jgi:hypothetical protein